MPGLTRVWFATDLHGSSLCFRKVLNVTKTAKMPDVIVVGGDISGKIVVPIVKSSGGRWSATFEGQRNTLSSRAEVRRFVESVASRGAYAIVCNRDELREFQENETYQEEVVRKLKCERLTQWIELADERLKAWPGRFFMNTGNDDPYYLDRIIEDSNVIQRPEGRIVEIDNWLSMASTGYANITPWKCPRDLPEAELAAKIDEMVRCVKDFDRCIFNFHCPPYGTLLDRARRIDSELRPEVSGFGAEEESVGSTAVREAVLKYQPSVSLHGHIHEQYCYERLGRTFCFNPGSEYSEGLVRGVYLEFQNGVLERFGLTREEIPRTRERAFVLNGLQVPALGRYQEWLRRVIGKFRSGGSLFKLGRVNAIAVQRRSTQNDLPPIVRTPS